MNANDIYHSICNFSPYSEQYLVFEKLSRQEKEEKLLFLRLPCGYGKTEAVIIPYLAQAIKNDWIIAPRLIYVLPTRALCNQIKDRIQKYANIVKQLIGKSLIVGVEHGTSSLDPLFFADICVTTFDQFLYGYARSKPQIGKHFDLPAGAIANSIVVFDEAHLYSPYTHSLMRAMIEILNVSRIPTIVMTATMPKTLENDLFSNVSKPEKIEYSEMNSKSTSNRIIQWEQQDWGLIENGFVSAKLLKILNENKGKKILIIANRVDLAQNLANNLQKRDDFITLLHSRFTAKDRDSKETIAIDSFGKENSKSGIIISTQVCEVGLDISCDLLITECAAADALVQRVGRVARWGGDGRVIIVRPTGTDSLINDDEWGQAFPYVDKKKDSPSQFKGIKSGEYAGIAWEYLKNKAPQNLFVDWSATTAFCNEMKYHTDDIEARGALGQLFDATLYADEVPWNLSARGDMYCTLAVISKNHIDQLLSSSVQKSKEDKRRGKKKSEEGNYLPYSELRQHIVNLNFKYLVSKKTDQLRPYDFEKTSFDNELDKKRVKPFQTYVLISDDKNIYDENIGLRLEKKEKADETEEGQSCLIL